MTTQERLSELGRLEEFFKMAALPQVPLKVGGFMTLQNIRTFIDTNFLRANVNIATIASEPCIYRLQQLEDVIKTQQTAS